MNGFVLLRIGLLKSLDKYIGSLLTTCLPKPSSAELDDAPSKTLIIRPGGIGDAVHLVPTLNAIKKSFPDAIIDVLAERRNAGVLSLCPHVNQVFLYDKPKDFLAVLRRCYDVVIDAEQWRRLSALVVRFVTARQDRFCHQRAFSDVYRYGRLLP